MAEAADAIAGYVGRGRARRGSESPGSYPAIDWSPVARMRDRVAHRYWATDREIVCATASDAVPALRRALGEALAMLG